MDSRSAMLSAAMFLIMVSGFSRTLLCGLLALDFDGLQQGEIDRQLGLPCRIFVELEDIRRDVAGLLRRQRARSVGGHRGSDAIVEIGDREVGPVADELEADERRSRFTPRQLRTVTARAEFVGNRFAALGLVFGIDAAPDAGPLCRRAYRDRNDDGRRSNPPSRGLAALRRDWRFRPFPACNSHVPSLVSTETVIIQFSL